MESQRSSAQQRCAYLSLCSNWKNHHSVDELNEHQRLLELVLHVHRDVHGHDVSQRRGGQHLYPTLAWRCPPPGSQGVNHEDLFVHHHLPEQELRQPGVSSGTSRKSDAGSASGRQEHCTEPRPLDSAPPTEKPTTRHPGSPPPPHPATPAEQPAWMGSSAEAVPTSSAEVLSHFFPLRKVRKTP